MKLLSIRAGFLLVSFQLVAGCSDGIHEDTENFLSKDPHPERSYQDPMRSSLARLFLVEQSRISVNPTMLQAIDHHTPGGVLFWNQGKASAQQTREVISTYSKRAEDAGRDPLLFSIDYEGGGIRKSLSGRSVPGIQRIRAGLTDLAHPAWLGVALNKGFDRVCYLHGILMAREMKSVGINYPLATVADLRKNLMKVRGVDVDPLVTSRCVVDILMAFNEVERVIFVTKHFPGLGSVVGDTHDGDSHSTLTDPRQMADHLRPFEELVKLAQAIEPSGYGGLSIMSSHAIFHVLDPRHLTTESSVILTDLLVGKIGFQGIRVSDAMWMGRYGSMRSQELFSVYVNAVIAGEDLLMIPGSQFSKALDFFRRFYDSAMDPSALSDGEKRAIVSRTEKSLSEAHSLFKDRLANALLRQKRAHQHVGFAHHFTDHPTVVPKDLTIQERAEYLAILQQAGLSL